MSTSRRLEHQADLLSKFRNTALPASLPQKMAQITSSMVSTTPQPNTTRQPWQHPQTLQLFWLTTRTLLYLAPIWWRKMIRPCRQLTRMAWLRCRIRGLALTWLCIDVPVGIRRIWRGLRDWLKRWAILSERLLNAEIMWCIHDS